MNCWIRCRSHWMKLHCWGNTQLNLLPSQALNTFIYTTSSCCSVDLQRKRRSKAQAWWAPLAAMSWWLDDPWLSKPCIQLGGVWITPYTRIHSSSLCPAGTWAQRWATPAHKGPRCSSKPWLMCLNCHSSQLQPPGKVPGTHLGELGPELLGKGLQKRWVGEAEGVLDVGCHAPTCGTGMCQVPRQELAQQGPQAPCSGVLGLPLEEQQTFREVVKQYCVWDGAKCSDETFFKGFFK